MRTETFKGSISTANGKKLDAPIDYSGSVQVYSDAAELKAAEKWPSDDDIVSFVNTELVNTARSSKVAATLAEAGLAKIGKRLESAEFRFTNMVKTLIASGKYTPAQAEAAAKELLG